MSPRLPAGADEPQLSGLRPAQRLGAQGAGDGHTGLLDHAVRHDPQELAVLQAEQLDQPEEHPLAGQRELLQPHRAVVGVLPDHVRGYPQGQGPEPFHRSFDGLEAVGGVGHGVVGVDVGCRAIHRPAFRKVAVSRRHGFQAFVKVYGLEYVVVVENACHGGSSCLGVILQPAPSGVADVASTRLSGADGVDALHRGGM